LHTFDSEIDRTFHRHDRIHWRSSIHTHNSFFIDSVHSANQLDLSDFVFDFSNTSHSESVHSDIETMANNNNRTLKELAAIDVNY